MTAEEFLIKNGDSDFRLSKSGMNLSKMMIEFAKFHVKAALKSAEKRHRETQTYEPKHRDIVRREILNSYPLNSIK